MRKIASRAWLLVFLGSLAIFPVVYPLLVSIKGVGPGLGRSLGETDFGSAADTPSSPSALLPYSSLALGSLRRANYTEAMTLLRSIGKLPPNIDHNLKTFIELLNETASILNSLKLRLDEARQLIADGAASSAREKLSNADGMLSEASKRLDLLFTSLERIQTIYGVDTSNQRADLEALTRNLTAFKETIAELKAQIESLDRRAVTQLDLAMFPSRVWINGTLSLRGQLRTGGAVLPRRFVEVWINKNRIANQTLDQNGRFDLQYAVSKIGRVNSFDVYARYAPVGEDIARFRPSKSVTSMIAVDYFPVKLTLSTSASKLHVMESLRAQGRLTDASGRPLAKMIVDLVIDGKPLNNAMTDSVGAFKMEASFPAETAQGDHQVYARFEPKEGIHASAISEKAVIQLFYLGSSFSLTVLKGVLTAGSEILAVSGQTLQLEGIIEIESNLQPEGIVIVALGRVELGRLFPEANGVFNGTFTIPSDATGDTDLTLLFVPSTPWISSASTSITVKILHVAIIGSAILAISFVALMLSGKSLELRSGFARRRLPRKKEGGETLAFEELEAEDDSTPLASRLDKLRALEPRNCVKETYWETRRVLRRTVPQKGPVSETHREFESRAVGRLSFGASSFSALTRLFELAEYSRHSISQDDAREGIRRALVVAQALSTETTS